MYDRIKRHEIQVLHRAGFSIREVAERAQVGVNTVLRILRRPEKEDTRRRGVGRPSVATAFETTVRALLHDEPDLPTVEILRRLREQRYSASKNPVYQLVRRLRPKNTYFTDGPFQGARRGVRSERLGKCAGPLRQRF